MKTNVAIRNLQKTVRINPPQLTVITKKILKSLHLHSADLSLVFVSDRRMKILNQKYLKYNFSTDVLAFDLREQKGSLRTLGGEIIISTDTAKRNSKIYGTTLKKEIVLYVIHGILHLVGYDDHEARDIRRMREKEQEILGKIITG